MVVRKPNTRTRNAVAREKTAATTRKHAAKPAPAKAAKKTPDYSHLLEKEPTEYHEAFTEWLQSPEVGFNPADTKNRAAAFLMGVSLGTSARSDFQQSEWLATWREENGVKKRGPAKGNARAEEPELDEDETDEEGLSEEELDALAEELAGLTLAKLKARAKKEGVALETGWKAADIQSAIMDLYLPEEDEADDEDADEGEEADALRQELTALTLPQVRAACKEYGLTYERTDKKADIIDAIIEAAFVDDEEAEDDEELEEDEELEDDEDEDEDESEEDDEAEEDEDEEEEPPARRPAGRKTVAKKTVTRGKTAAGKKGKYVF